MSTARTNITGISYEALGALFPMHVVLDDAGIILQVGPTLEKILKRDLKGQAFLDAFEIRKPRSAKTFDAVKKNRGRKIVVSGKPENRAPVDFRCLATPIGERGEGLLIDFAFSADFVDLVPELGLNASDFKPNDFSLDLIYTIETQRTLVEDSHRLTLALKDSKKEAEQAANVDMLTGIANRRALYKYLGETAACPIASDSCVLLHIDLDHFKAINDRYGHAAGDRVLQHAAAVLQDLSEDTDFPARIGGDEFAMTVSGRANESEILLLANSIRNRILAPIEFDGNIFQVGASIGVVELRSHLNASPDALLTCSDIALYEAKRTGEPVIILTDEMLDRHNARAALIEEIVSGLENDEFVPFFQPKVNTRDRSISGIEVLARWEHPQRGLVPPAAFIKEAESAKLMGSIERAIMKKAICAFKNWIDQGLQIGRLSFNLTAANLHSLSFVRSIEQELAAAELTSDDIELELLESVIFERSDSSLLVRCKELREAGFHLALDDFGTGHASISTLIDNPISTIKIDRSFVSGINREERLQRITRSILALSKQLDLDVVAEGVETQKELDVLSAFGCHVVQGYLFSRPENANTLTKWLQAWQEATSGMLGQPTRKAS